MFAWSTLGMVAPLRIDHHGWQLALMMVMVSGLVMRRRAAGGAVSGLALGLSLAIGIELLPYLGLTAAITSLFWVADRAEAPRMAAFGAASAGAAALSLMLLIPPDARWLGDRQRAVWGKGVSVRVDIDGRRSIKTKNKHKKQRAP